MKKILVISLSCILITLTIMFINPITDFIAKNISDEPTLVLKDKNEYSKNDSYLYVQLTNDFIPYSRQDLLNILYTSINNGWESFTFYCPSEYTNCLDDITKISGDDLILTHLNNYVHPFNSFTNIKTTINDTGELTLTIFYLYKEDVKKQISLKVDEIIKNNVKSDMDDFEKIKVIHDYIINNSKYDVERNEKENSKYDSYTAYGPLFEGFATCNGYTDLMAIFLSKMNFNNIKIATTPGEISYSSTGHVWNAVLVNNEWLHLDLTWDDPVSSDKLDYLFHTYFLVTTEALKEADKGETTIEEHNFNKQFYLEFNK
ncbi:MAG: transglutaminase domain-containing protein [Bacilli bacterium]